MNFLSHYYLDRYRNNSHFFVGACTPDLVSIYNRSVRLKAHSLPQPDKVGNSPQQIAFYQGIVRHFEVDQLFHSSDFFHAETRYFSDLLREHFGADRIHRAFFVSHILLELMLDKILMEREPALVPDFYRWITDPGLQFVVSLTEWATQRPLPNYDGFYEKFITNQYLYHYTRWEEVIYVLRRILQRVGIARFEYLHSPKFLQLVQNYQEELSPRCFTAMDGFMAQLGSKTHPEP